MWLTKNMRHLISLHFICHEYWLYQSCMILNMIVRGILLLMTTLLSLYTFSDKFLVLCIFAQSRQRCPIDRPPTGRKVNGIIYMIVSCRTSNDVWDYREQWADWHEQDDSDLSDYGLQTQHHRNICVFEKIRGGQHEDHLQLEIWQTSGCRCWDATDEWVCRTQGAASTAGGGSSYH